MLGVLFSSKTRVKILSLLIMNPRNRYYLREIIKVIGAQAQAVQRELGKLESVGLICKEKEGNRTYYKINPDHIVFPELKSIFLKTVGFGELLKAPLLGQKDIEAAFIYGSYAENTETAKSDIDIFIIGSISGKKFHSLLRKLSQSRGRAINPVIYSVPEFKKKKNGHFISSVLKKPKIILKGDPDVL